MEESDFVKVGPTAYHQAEYRVIYGIPYSKEILEQMSKHNLSTMNIPGRDFIIPAFEARYKGTDEVLKSYIEDSYITQILELASGMSPQGMIYAKTYPHVTYVETDLDYMVEIKENIVRTILGSVPQNLHVVQANCLDLDSLERGLQTFDPLKPVVVFHIGLISYLTIDEKKILAQNIRHILSKFGGVWITPDLAMHNKRRMGMYRDLAHKQEVDAMIAQRTGTNYDAKSFEDEHDTDAFLRDVGFDIKKISQLSGYEMLSFAELNLGEGERQRILDNLHEYGKVWVLSVKR
ncbi:MAG TPA: class I SAM-dependent methyltransferase [Candidatus Andersenbacteria bacterium]|nr:class I SAM-dependent methyltransferase [Candidatus Andersenbacteria bacterium]